MTEAGRSAFGARRGTRTRRRRFSESQAEGVEHAPWASLRAFEDRVELARLRADRARARGYAEVAADFTVEWEVAQTHATALWTLLRTLLRSNGRGGGRPQGSPDRPE